MARTIAVVSGKGGTGKTLFATSLGAALSTEFKKRVLLVEGNLTSPGLGVFLNIVKPATTIKDVLSGQIPPEKAVFRHDNGLDVLPGALSIGSGGDSSKAQILQNLLSNYDYAIIDCSGAIGPDEIAFSRIADESVIVSTPDLPAITGAMKISGTLQSEGIQVKGVVINRSKAGDKRELKNSEIEGSIGKQVIGRIPEDSAVPQSAFSRTPLTLFSPFSPAASEIRNIASDLCGIPRQKKRSFLESVFGAKKEEAPRKNSEFSRAGNLDGLRESVVKAPIHQGDEKAGFQKGEGWKAPPAEAKPALAEVPSAPEQALPQAYSSLQTQKNSPATSAPQDKQKLKDSYMKEWMDGKITLDQMMEKVKGLEKA